MRTTYLLACDRQRTPIAGSGFPTRSHAPYGSLPSISGPRLAFCAQVRETGIDRYHLGNGHRVYNPLLMRFQSADGHSPFGAGGINAYAYCAGDPINRVDPTGRSWFSSMLHTLLSGLPGSTNASITATAVLRSADDVSKRLTLPADRYQPLSPSKQLGNTMAFYAGVTGLTDKILQGSHASPLGLSGSALAIGGSAALNWEMARDVLQRVWNSDVSAWEVAMHTTYQVTGARQVVGLLTTAAGELRSGYETLPGETYETTLSSSVSPTTRLIS